MNQNMIWAEMARRKVRFHKDEDWNKISLWGLFNQSDIKRQLEKGQLIMHSNYVKRAPAWVTPSEEAWEKYIKPLIEKHTLDELTIMAGW